MTVFNNLQLKKVLTISSLTVLFISTLTIFSSFHNNKSIALADGPSYLDGQDTAEFKDLQRPQKGGGILYSQYESNGNNIYNFNCNTKTTTNLGKLKTSLNVNNYNKRTLEIKGKPGFINSGDKLSWIYQIHETVYSMNPYFYYQDWFVDGTNGNKAKLDTQVLQSDWKLKVITDMNGDGKEDLIWRNEPDSYSTKWSDPNSDAGKVALWYTINPKNQATDSKFLERVQDSNWDLIGAGDVDGDNKSELLWQNNKTKQVALWTYRNGYHEGTYLPNYIYPESIIGLADCDGDNKSEVIVRVGEKVENKQEDIGGPDSGSYINFILGYWKVNPQTLTSDGKVFKLSDDKGLINRIITRYGGEEVIESELIKVGNF
jgi:hypothetical protein